MRRAWRNRTFRSFLSSHRNQYSTANLYSQIVLAGITGRSDHFLFRWVSAFNHQTADWGSLSLGCPWGRPWRSRQGTLSTYIMQQLERECEAICAVASVASGGWGPDCPKGPEEMANLIRKIWEHENEIGKVMIITFYDHEILGYPIFGQNHLLMLTRGYCLSDV